MHHHLFGCRSSHVVGRGRSFSAAVAVALLAVVVPATSSSAADLSPTGPSDPSGVSAAAAPGLDPALVAQLEAALDEGFAASALPGVTVGLWIPGQGEWVSSRGVSDLETQAPMDRANQYKIGSITKTLTAMVGLQVIDQGQSGLSLDDTIDRWYPDFPEASRITVAMLMNMSSGVAEWDPGQVDMICANPHNVISPDEVIAIGATLPRAPFAPGEGFQYSGTNTFLLGRILEKTTGTDLTTLIDTHLLDPLGMTRSRFAPDGVLAPPLTRGYTNLCPDMAPLTDATDWSLHEAWAAGAMLSTIDDLHTWATALGDGYDLSPEMNEARIIDAAPFPNSPGISYGLGANVRRDLTTDCLVSLSHAGAEPGYGANIIVYPATGAAFALVSNLDGGDDDAMNAVIRTLAPVFDPVLAEPSTTACTPTELPPDTPTPAATTATPVAATPTYTG